MDIIITVITVIGGIITGGFFQWLYSRKQHRKQKQGEADKAVADADSAEWANYQKQLDRMNDQVEFKDKRILALLEQNEQKETHWQERYSEQTVRLRDFQDKYYEAQNTILSLNHRISELEQEKKDTQCIRLTCWKRRPENQYSRRAKALIKQDEALIEEEDFFAIDEEIAEEC